MQELEAEPLRAGHSQRPADEGRWIDRCRLWVEGLRQPTEFLERGVPAHPSFANGIRPCRQARVRLTVDEPLDDARVSSQSLQQVVRERLARHPATQGASRKMSKSTRTSLSTNAEAPATRIGGIPKSAGNTVVVPVK